MEAMTAKILGFSVQFFSYGELINLFEEIFIYQIYKFSSATSRPLIIDCGSNIGLSVLYFKTIYPTSRIYAFEPDSQSYKLLEENIQINKLDQINVFNYALTDIDKNVLLYKRKSSFNSLNTSLIPIVDSDAEIVQAKKLSDFLHEKVEMVKVDVEGSESQIITDIIENKKIDLVSQMIIEFHPQVIQGSINEYFALLERSGLLLKEVKKSSFPNAPDVVAHFVRKQ